MKYVRLIIPKSIAVILLHYANSSPSCRTRFYALKDRLLNQFAEFRGHDIQEIVKECYGDKRDEYGDWHGCGPKCRRCGGTRIFSRRWVRLQRWQWGKYVFHIPDGDTYVKPESVRIQGRIEHVDYGKSSREAELWLYLFALRFGDWWHVLSTSCYCSPGLWPMCRLQKLAMWARMTFKRQKCLCGRKFTTWGSGWMVCKKCRSPKAVEQRSVDVPF